MNRVSDFMLQLSKDLIDQRKITESSAQLYIKNLWTLNDKKIFNNLAFLKEIDNIETKLSEYADNTKKTFLAGIVSVLSLFKDKPSYKKTYQHYYDAMMKKDEEIKENVDPNQKTEKEEENWLSWEDVILVKTALKTASNELNKQKLITPEQYNVVLSYVILSLYTEIPPRRNQDYQDMFVISSLKDSGDKEKNYLDWSNKKFIFNHYKTAKKYGIQTIDISDKPDLLEAITIYLKFHPLSPSKGKALPKNAEFRFLVYSDGGAFSAVNSITRILNRIFGGKRIGSSQLRHIYLSSKYDIEEMKKDAEEMGHSIEEQKQYLKAPSKSNII